MDGNEEPVANQKEIRSLSPISASPFMCTQRESGTKNEKREGDKNKEK